MTKTEYSEAEAIIQKLEAMSRAELWEWVESGELRKCVLPVMQAIDAWFARKTVETLWRNGHIEAALRLQG